MQTTSPWTKMHCLTLCKSISLKLESFAWQNYVSFSSCEVFLLSRQNLSGTFAWVNTLNLFSPDKKDFCWQLTFFSSTIIQNNRTLFRATPISMNSQVCILPIDTDEYKVFIHQMVNFVDLRSLLISVAYLSHEQQDIINRVLEVYRV